MFRSVHGVHAQKWNTPLLQAFFRYRKASEKMWVHGSLPGEI
jgi:hypothetical protein